jgi:hypothetical protein
LPFDFLTFHLAIEQIKGIVLTEISTMPARLSQTDGKHEPEQSRKISLIFGKLGAHRAVAKLTVFKVFRESQYLTRTQYVKGSETW